MSKELPDQRYMNDIVVIGDNRLLEGIEMAMQKVMSKQENANNVHKLVLENGERTDDMTLYRVGKHTITVLFNRCYKGIAEKINNKVNMEVNPTVLVLTTAQTTDDTYAEGDKNPFTPDQHFVDGEVVRYGNALNAHMEIIVNHDVFTMNNHGNTTSPLMLRLNNIQSSDDMGSYMAATLDRNIRFGAIYWAEGRQGPGQTLKDAQMKCGMTVIQYACLRMYDNMWACRTLYKSN